MPVTNNRTFQAFHGGATAATANINGIANGGLVSGAIQFGKDRISRSSGDAQPIGEVGVFIDFVRGTITSQDWPDIISLLTGTVGTYIFYEKEPGAATVTINTITAPVIHRADFNLVNFSPASITWAFECRAAANDDALTDMWARLAAQAAPVAKLTANRGDVITACTHGATTVNHVSGLTFNIGATLVKGEPGDGDTCYTAVDVAYPFSIGGTLTTQDLTTALTLGDNASGDLVLTIGQMSGAAAKTLTIKNVMFTGNGANLGQGYTGYNMAWVLNSPSATPLTLATAIIVA